MFSNGKTIIVILFSAVLVQLVGVNHVNAKYRDAINFEDNRFVGISQFEAFHSYRYINGSDSDNFDGSKLEYQITGGLMTNFEVGAKVPIIFYDNGTNGLGDISLIQRFKFTQETDQLPQSSGGLELFLPTGDEDDNPPTGTDHFSARLFGTIGNSINRDWRWLTNGGVRLFGGDDFDEKWEYNAALRYQYSRPLKFIGELNGRTGGIRDESEIFLSPGTVMQTKGGFNAMISFPIGLTNDSADYETSVQFAYEF